VITYGMGVYWTKAAAAQLQGMIEIVDLRTLYPLDEQLIFERVKLHGKCLVVTEEQQNNSFAEALAGRISHHCFQFLDGPVEILGALNVPAVPMNTGLEKAMLPDPGKILAILKRIISS
jgi:2-oxoisovalerate dehydrogenase E1 component